MPEKTQDFVALRQILTEILGEICSLSDCQSVGIRLHNNGDYPYYVNEGFPDFFITKENSICARDDEGNLILDEDGNPLLECMCGNVLKGQIRPKTSTLHRKGKLLDQLHNTAFEDNHREGAAGSNTKYVQLQRLRIGGFDSHESRQHNIGADSDE